MGEETSTSRTEVDRSEGFGERLLGTLIDRAHEMPPHLIAPLIAHEVELTGGCDVAVLLQGYDPFLKEASRGSATLQAVGSATERRLG